MIIENKIFGVLRIIRDLIENLKEWGEINILIQTQYS